MDLKGKKFVLVGGAGLIGSHTLDCLLDCLGMTQRAMSLRAKLACAMSQRVGTRPRKVHSAVIKVPW